MRATPSSACLLNVLVAAAIALPGAAGCGSSSKARSVIPDDGGADGAAAAPVNSGTGGVASGTGGARNSGGVTGSGGRVASGGAAGGLVDASATVPDASVTPDASVPLDAGLPALGDYCNFAGGDLESSVRQALSNQPIDGGVPRGPIPVTLAARVTALDLFCDCSDAIDLTGIECLTGLEKLTLAGDFSNLDRVARLPSLREMRFQYVSDNLPSELATFTQLASLDVGNARLTDISLLAGLTNLTELELSNNQVEDLSPLAGMTKLVKLRLYSNRLKTLAPLAGLRKLEELNVSYNQLTSLSPLSGVTSLVTLYASQNAIVNLSGLSGLTNLASLDVSINPAIKDFSPLVANAGIGAGDTISATPAASDCASFKADAATLTARGALLAGFPQCP